MELKITNKAKGKSVANGDAIPINVTKDKCCATLNTRYEAISVRSHNELGTLSKNRNTIKMELKITKTAKGKPIGGGVFDTHQCDKG